VTQHYVNLWWNPSTGAAGYNVYRSASANGTYAKINSTLDPNTAYTDSTVVSGQTYYYEATAVDSGGQESARSTPPVQASIPWSRGFCKTIEASEVPVRVKKARTKGQPHTKPSP
jgi:fibronectin type 3 domain-containing protein